MHVLKLDEKGGRLLKYRENPFKGLIFSDSVYSTYQIMASLCFCCNKVSFLLCLGRSVKQMGCEMIIKLTLLGCLY